MSKPTRPASRPIAILVDPRSTAASPGPRLPDILGLRGTKTS